MNVEVYGGNHSPWVQAVLLGLHEKGIDYSLRSTPPIDVLKSSGVFMPMVSIDGGEWQGESSEILVKLGFEPIAETDLQAVRGAWQGVLHRPDNPLRFFVGFSRSGDKAPSLLTRTVRNYLRSFVPFYMFTLINFVKLKRKPKDPDDFGEQYLYWESALQDSSGPFLDGQVPGIRDIMLFGIIQCHCSIPVPPLAPLIDDERLDRLRGWLGVMHERFQSYPMLYSGSYFEPKVATPVPASLPQRGIFFLGLITMITAFPVTLPLVFLLMKRAPR